MSILCHDSLFDNKKRPESIHFLVFSRTGSVLFLQALSQLPSAMECLTSVFGTGTGISTSLSPPDLLLDRSLKTGKIFQTQPFRLFQVMASSLLFSDQVLGLLVPVHSGHRCPSIPGLSTLSSSRGLTSLFKIGRSHLGVGFVLRCFQLLSLPCLATRLCSWRNNRCTSGRSIPVLSY